MDNKNIIEAGKIAIKRAHKMNLSLTEYLIHGIINESKKISINEIYIELGIDRTTVSKAVKRLENKGLIFYKIDNQDKRRKLYEIKK